MAAPPRKQCSTCKGWLVAERLLADKPCREVRVFRRSITLLTCPKCDTATPTLDRESKAIHQALADRA